MNPFLLRFFSCSILSFLCVGCESVGQRLNERLAEVPPQSQQFDGSPDAVYRAAQRAFRRLDFVLVRTSPGRIQAASAIHTSVAFGDSRQLVADLRLRDDGDGKVVADLWLTADETSSSFGGTHRQPLRENSFFPTYFAVLKQVVDEDSAPATGQRN